MKTTLTLFVMLVLFGLPAVAAPGCGNGPDFLPPAGYLDLTPDQADATRALIATLQADLAPIQDELRMLRPQLAEALGGDDPDAVTVGGLVIAISDLRQDRRDRLQGFEVDFTALLDSGQLAEWEAWKELRRLERRPAGAGSMGAGPDDSGPADGLFTDR
ncbi:MAG: periplasmic heavy metal sensor [Acidobacteriota bacterium]